MTREDTPVARESKPTAKSERPLRSPRIRAARVLGWLTGVALMGCGVAEPTALTVELTVSSAVVSPAQPIEVAVTATNRSTVAVDVYGSPCPRAFEVVRTGVPAIVGPEQVPCPLLVVAPTRLEPGQSTAVRYQWAGLGADDQPLPPGVYRLRGWIDVVSGDRVYSDYRLVEVAG